MLLKTSTAPTPEDLRWRIWGHRFVLRYDFIVRPTKRRIRLYDVMAVNAVTPFTVLQGILGPFFSQHPSPKSYCWVTVFILFFARHWSRCLVSSRTQSFSAWSLRWHGLVSRISYLSPSASPTLPCQPHQLINNLTPPSSHHCPHLPVRTQLFTMVNLDPDQCLSKDISHQF